MRFKVNYTVGKKLRSDTIEAVDLDDAERKVNQRHPSWMDIVTINKQAEVEKCN